MNERGAREERGRNERAPAHHKREAAVGRGWLPLPMLLQVAGQTGRETGDEVPELLAAPAITCLLVSVRMLR